MSVVNLLTDRWAQSGYRTRAAAIVYAAPIAIWGVCTLEVTVRCAFRALHTAVAFNQESRSYRWGQTKMHFWTAYGTGLLTGVSAFPILGTGESYAAMFTMVTNYTSNTWRLRELHQRANSHAADTLYHELNGWEPDLDKIFSDALEKVAPTKQQIDETAEKLQASLIGRSWIFTALFHTVDGTCRAVRIVAIRISRLISALFSGRIIRIIVRTAEVIINGIKQQVQYTSNLIDQPGRGDIPIRDLPEIYLDAIHCVIEKCRDNEDDWRETARLAMTGHGANPITIVPAINLFRYCAISNFVARDSKDVRVRLPEGAPNNYIHCLRMLPKACAHFSKVKATKTVAEVNKEKAEILNYFQSILPVIETFETAYTANMTGEAKQELLLALVKLMPNLREISLDMKDVDPRWQMLIAVQLAKFSKQLTQVTFLNADQRTAKIMRRYCSLFCTVKLGTAPA